jgi:hypothetical protein
MPAGLPSEQQMFKVVVLVGIAAVPVILLALLVSPLAGFIVMCVEIGVGIGLVWRLRGAARATVPSRGGDGIQRLLVLAGAPIDSVEALDEVSAFADRFRFRQVRLLACGSEDPERLHERLDAALRSVRSGRVQVEGEMTSQEPLEALNGVLTDYPADEIVIVTWAAAESEWLDDGVVAKAGLQIETPIHHVIAQESGAA